MWHLVLPHFGLGLGIGVVDSALMPLLAFLVDERRSGAYGAVYAIAQVRSALGRCGKSYYVKKGIMMQIRSKHAH